jgi:hypothetical protein
MHPSDDVPPHRQHHGQPPRFTHNKWTRPPDGPSPKVAPAAPPRRANQHQPFFSRERSSHIAESRQQKVESGARAVARTASSLPAFSGAFDTSTASHRTLDILSRAKNRQVSRGSTGSTRSAGGDRRQSSIPSAESSAFGREQPQQKLVDFNGLHGVPTGPKRVSSTASFGSRNANLDDLPYIDRSTLSAPHMFIPAHSLPACLSLRDHLQNVVQHTGPKGVYCDARGHYVVYPQGKSGEGSVKACIRRVDGMRLCGEYILEPVAYLPSELPVLADGGRNDEHIDGNETTFMRDEAPAATGIAAAGGGRAFGPWPLPARPTNNVPISGNETTSTPNEAPAVAGITAAGGGEMLGSSPLSVRSRSERDKSPSALSGRTGTSSDFSVSKKSCHVCKHTSTSATDALITCSTCPRRYHRRCHISPAIPQDVDRWQCRRCINKGVKPNPAYESTLADASHALGHHPASLQAAFDSGPGKTGEDTSAPRAHDGAGRDGQNVVHRLKGGILAKDAHLPESQNDDSGHGDLTPIPDAVDKKSSPLDGPPLKRPRLEASEPARGMPNAGVSNSTQLFETPSELHSAAIDKCPAVQAPESHQISLQPTLEVSQSAGPPSDRNDSNPSVIPETVISPGAENQAQTKPEDQAARLHQNNTVGEQRTSPGPSNGDLDEADDLVKKSFEPAKPPSSTATEAGEKRKKFNFTRTKIIRPQQHTREAPTQDSEAPVSVGLVQRTGAPDQRNGAEADASSMQQPSNRPNHLDQKAVAAYAKGAKPPAVSATPKALMPTVARKSVAAQPARVAEIPESPLSVSKEPRKDLAGASSGSASPAATSKPAIAKRSVVNKVRCSSCRRTIETRPQSSKLLCKACKEQKQAEATAVDKASPTALGGPGFPARSTANAPNGHSALDKEPQSIASAPAARTQQDAVKEVNGLTSVTGYDAVKTKRGPNEDNLDLWNKSAAPVKKMVPRNESAPGGLGEKSKSPSIATKSSSLPKDDAGRSAHNRYEREERLESAVEMGKPYGPASSKPTSGPQNQHRQPSEVVAPELYSAAQMSALELEYSKLEHELKELNKTDVRHGETIGKVAKDTLFGKCCELVIEVDNVRKASKIVKDHAATVHAAAPLAPTAPATAAAVGDAAENVSDIELSDPPESMTSSRESITMKKRGRGRPSRPSGEGPPPVVKAIGMALCEIQPAQPRRICSWIAENVPGYDSAEALAATVSATVSLNEGVRGKKLFKSRKWQPNDETEYGKGSWVELQPEVLKWHERWDPVLKRPVSPPPFGDERESNEQDIESGEVVEQSDHDALSSSPDPLHDRMAKARAGKVAKRMLIQQAKNKAHDESSDDEPLSKLRRLPPKAFTAPTALMQAPGGGDPIDIDPIGSTPKDVRRSFPLPTKPARSYPPVTMEPASEGARTDSVHGVNELSRVTSTANDQAKRKPMGLSVSAEQAKDMSVEEIMAADSEIRDYSARSFFEEWPEYHPKNQIDKEAKKQEIKQRPTRKQMFGKPACYSRLGSNVTAPSATSSATTPVSSKPSSRGVANSLKPVTKPAPEWPFPPADGENIKYCQSIQEFFDLPNNPMPIIHQGELAYRDGTRDENGALPRAKVIYKCYP